MSIAEPKDAESAPACILVPIPSGFQHDEALLEVAALAVALLNARVPVRVLLRRLARVWGEEAAE